MTSPDAFLTQFGGRVRSARLKAGLTQVQLAERCGKRHQYVSSVENGHRNITLATLLQIASALGREPADLLPSSMERP